MKNRVLEKPVYPFSVYSYLYNKKKAVYGNINLHFNKEYFTVQDLEQYFIENECKITDNFILSVNDKNSEIYFLDSIEFEKKNIKNVCQNTKSWSKIFLSVKELMPYFNYAESIFSYIWRGKPFINQKLSNNPFFNLILIQYRNSFSNSNCYIELTYNKRKIGFIIHEENDDMITINGCYDTNYETYNIVNKLSELIFIKKKEYEDNLYKDKSTVNFVTLSQEGLKLKEVNYNLKNKIYDLNLYYNDDFIDYDVKIKQTISKKDNKGFILLYGEPGTGKSNYIEYITKYCLDNDLKAVYITSSILDIFSAPNFIDFAVENLKNTILIIEDAEELLKSRDIGRNSAISNLLNLTDGLLSSTINCKIICTFNTQLSNIDKALLREGRLSLSYCFGKLNKEKTDNLRKGLNLPLLEKDSTLSEIFNSKLSNEKSINNRKSVGF